MTEVVVSVEPNPKRVNSGAWHRYARYYVGADEARLLALGLTAADLRWDRRQRHVVWGPGEAREPPEDLQGLSRAVGEGGTGTPVGSVRPGTALEEPRRRTRPGPTGTRATTRATGAPVPATAAAPDESSTALEEPRLPASLALPPGRVERDVGPVDRPARWWLAPRRITGAAPPADQSRTWTIRADLPDGRTATREVRGDRLAENLVAATAAHGLDPDDWRIS